MRTGDLIRQCGCLHLGVLGGWVRDRRSNDLMLLTVAHILAPRRGVYARDWDAAPLPRVREEPDRWLCRAGDSEPVARVVRAGVCDPWRRTRSLDALVATPVEPVQVDPGPGVALAVVGRQALVRHPCGRQVQGRVVATGWHSRHYGASNDILIASCDEMPFSRAGMSGSLVLDSASGRLLGLLVGEVVEPGLPQLGGTPLACVHPIHEILDLLDLVPA